MQQKIRNNYASAYRKDRKPASARPRQPVPTVLNQTQPEIYLDNFPNHPRIQPVYPFERGDYGGRAILPKPKHPTARARIHMGAIIGGKGQVQTSEMLVKPERARLMKRERAQVSRFRLAKSTRRVCVLEWQVGKRFSDRGTESPCSCHRHVKREVAESLVMCGDASWLGVGQNVVSLREPLREPKGNNAHTWAMFRIANWNKRNLCVGGLVSPR